MPRTFRTLPWPPNFRESEFNRGGLSPIPNAHKDAMKTVAWILQTYRTSIFDNRAITITNAYRTPADLERLRQAGYNPARNSYHFDGQAADFVVQGLSAQEVQRRLRAAGWTGGLGTGSNFTHIDLGNKREFSY